MKCRECRAELSEYLDGRLSDARRRDFEEHAQACPECSALLEKLTEVRTAVGNLELRQTSDTFSFNMKRLLQEEAEKERTWFRILRARVRPIRQAIWAASIGTAAALILTVSAGMTPFNNTATAASDGSDTDSVEYVHYVLDNVPLAGDSIGTPAGDTTNVAEAPISEETESSPVSASF